MAINIQALDLLQKIYEISQENNPPKTKTQFSYKLKTITQDHDITVKLVNELYKEGLLNFAYIKKFEGKDIEINNIITKKGRQELGIEEMPSDLINLSAEINALNIALQKTKPSPLFENIKSSKKLAFEGILGQNCGEIVKYMGTEKRLQEKGYVVEEGTTVLRGFAKMSELEKVSIPDSSYQRNQDIDHTKGIKNFLKNGKIKFLPEVVLVARNKIELQELKLGFQKDSANLGKFENINYRKIEVEPKSLYRVDGNHRLEAYEEGAKNDYYLPFAIILWEDSTTAKDDEAFLFYFLNGKAKKLTTNENFKGLIESTSWSEDALREASPILPLLQQFHRQCCKDNLLFCEENYDNRALEQMANILEKSKIYEDDENIFIETVLLTNQILGLFNQFSYLRNNFDFFCQFVFYSVNKLQDKNKTVKFIEKVSKWAEKYDYKKGSFECPLNLYETADKFFENKEYKIFVAMPYYNADMVTEYNSIFDEIIASIKKKNPDLNLIKHKIMQHEGSTVKLDSDIDQKIQNCEIFIADISETNPNVMYELGLATSLKKPRILIKRNDKKTSVPFDINNQFRREINFSLRTKSIKGMSLDILSILKNEYGLPIND